MRGIEIVLREFVIARDKAGSLARLRGTVVPTLASPLGAVRQLARQAIRQSRGRGAFETCLLPLSCEPSTVELGTGGGTSRPGASGGRGSDAHLGR